MEDSASHYSQWSHEDLVKKINILEKKLRQVEKRTRSIAQPQLNSESDCDSSSIQRPVKKPRTFDWSRHHSRLIALKFAYLGRNYNGFEHHANNSTPLPTVEEVLWHALVKAKLINPTTDDSASPVSVSWEGCEYTKCGRTDRGVSAFGQVIGLKVRSKRALPELGQARSGDSLRVEDESEALIAKQKVSKNESIDFDDKTDELPYIQMLNSLLPSDIRILAWCPEPPDGFSARFTCRARHYKYFFTQPSFTPTPGVLGMRNSRTLKSDSDDSRREGWLDISLMQQAAKRFEGLHDFRNFCKVDGSKQISDHRRRIFESEIRALAPSEEPAAYANDSLFTEFSTSCDMGTKASSTGPVSPRIYVFDLKGTAFLWHQVRHMVAILFLVGQGLEPPEVVDHLLDTSLCPEKPHYEMADEAPLVLWDCYFPKDGDHPLEDSLTWIYAGEESLPATGKHELIKKSTKFGPGATMDEVWGLWRDSKIDEVLKGALLNRIARQADSMTTDKSFDLGRFRKNYSQKVFQGGRAPQYHGNYIPLLERKRMKSVDTVNREYAEKHGFVFQDKKANKDTKMPTDDFRRDHIDI